MERTTERHSPAIDARAHDEERDHTYDRAVTPTELPLELLAERLWRLVPEGLVEEIRDGLWWHRVSVRADSPH